VPLPTVSCSPVGFDWKLRSTVWGSSRTLSVSVSRSSIQAGYSWSGAENEPLATRLLSVKA
jgi:hypothetical protein